MNFTCSQEEGLAELENRSRWLIWEVPPGNLGKTQLVYKEWSTSYVIQIWPIQEMLSQFLELVGVEVVYVGKAKEMLGKWEEMIQRNNF